MQKMNVVISAHGIEGLTPDNIQRALSSYFSSSDLKVSFFVQEAAPTPPPQPYPDYLTYKEFAKSKFINALVSQYAKRDKHEFALKLLNDLYDKYITDEEAEVLCLDLCDTLHMFNTLVAQIEREKKQRACSHLETHRWTLGGDLYCKTCGKSLKEGES